MLGIFFSICFAEKQRQEIAYGCYQNFSIRSGPLDAARLCPTLGMQSLDEKLALLRVRGGAAPGPQPWCILQTGVKALLCLHGDSMQQPT